MDRGDFSLRQPKIIFDGAICISPSAIYTDSHKIFHGTISYKNYAHYDALYALTHTQTAATQSNAPTLWEKNDKKVHTNTNTLHTSMNLSILKFRSFSKFYAVLLL